MARKIAMLCGIVLLAACLAACGKDGTAGHKAAGTVEITDMIGRKVTVPRNIKKIYGTNPNSTILVYSFDPAKIAGANSVSTSPRQFSTEQFRRLPVLGSMLGAEGTRANIEKILQAAPDLIVTVTMADMGDRTTGEQADRMQNQLHIPVVVVNSNLTKLDRTYTFMGELLGEQEQAREMADYCRRTISEIGSMVAKIPEEKRVRVYYAEGLAGLATAPTGSRHTEVLDFVRGVNVAEVPMNPGGQAAVSLEKVMLWDPDVIIAGNTGTSSGGGGVYDNITSDGRWANIKAVKERRVYDIPNQPFNWFDRPPSINRIIGVKWLANLLYPDYVKLDIKSEVKRFYQLFYHYELTDQETEALLRHATQN